MIAGIGVDIIEIERVIRACEKPSFCNRCFTQAEQRLMEQDRKKAASNFAVKEAVVKAFGTGFGKISPDQIEVLRNEKGMPYVNLYHEAADIAKELAWEAIHVSVSHTKELVTAYVVAEKN